jgi:hypothetical protein
MVQTISFNLTEAADAFGQPFLELPCELAFKMIRLANGRPMEMALALRLLTDLVGGQ